ncbi:MAG TPA: helix-hairpin-helix domain-containing protein [Candidatus Nanopelagicales bacterium]|nr:helix-hairpin-helix domain-containing protein [Candidatus Nanopelagicales bacterium]
MLRSSDGSDERDVRARLRALVDGREHGDDPGDEHGGMDGTDAEPVAPSGVVAAVGAGRALLLVALVAVVAAAWLTWHSQGADLAPRVIPAAVPAPSASAGAAGSPDAPPPLVVQVLGAVREPGVFRLPNGARVQDALRAAGGLRPGRSTGGLNLARRLVDGEQVVVGRRNPAAQVPNAGGGAGTSPPGAPLDLNTADQPMLETLPGVGPVTAAAILAYRTEHGRFTTIDQLQEVDGIGPVTYQRLAPLLVVDGHR